MKSLGKYILLFLIFNSFYCASVKQYLYNRGNDLTDIVNIGVEKDIFGINFQIVGVAIGYQNASSGVGFGLRYGYFGKYKTGDNQNKISISDYEGEKFSKREEQIYPGDSNLSISTFYHQPQNLKELRIWKKQIMRVDFLFRRCYSSTKAIYMNKQIRKGSKCYFTESYSGLSSEFSFGAYLGIRIGFNLRELIDFLVGFGGFDPIDDDISNTEPGYNELPPTALENKDWESKFDTLDEKMNRKRKK